MKRSSVAISVLTFCAVMVALGFFPPQKAHAEGEVVCIITVNATTATDTQQMTDAGTACNWAAGAAVIMQCPNIEVYYDPATNDRNADGGLPINVDAGIRGPVASSTDLAASFISNPDPVLIGLNPNEKNISLLMNSAADAGASGICKFAATRRRIPAP